MSNNKIELMPQLAEQNCYRVLDAVSLLNGQNWWVCHRCGSTWHELVNGKHWLPLSCPGRNLPDYKERNRS